MSRLGIQFAIGGALLLGLLGVGGGFAIGAMGHSSDHSHTESVSGPVAPGGELEAYTYSPPKEIAGFTLTDQDGQPFSIDGAGKVRVVYIGYTNCPDVCPLTMINLKNVRQRLGAQAGQVTFVMITADPAHDTPPVMKTFLSGFDTSFIGLSGGEQELARAWAEFGAPVNIEPAPDSAAGYSVSHPATLYVLNKNGQLAKKIPYGRTVAGITDDVRGLLD
ncbi:MAG: SCO family protein [Dehalococcoidia bacterium]|nr:MAG: SCO family protein [Dehalococcoidia bacterium]